MGQTLDQKRAAHALDKVQSVKKLNHDGMYVSYVSSFPSMIVMNGLGQALVMQLAKAKNENDSHHLLHDHVAEWLSMQIDKLKGPKEQVIMKLMKNDQKVYLRAQAETMAYVNWLKQFARAYLKEEKKGGDNE